MKMALVYFAPFLLILQVTANPLDGTDMTSTEVVSLDNDTLQFENSTGSLLPLTNLTSLNETVVDSMESTEVTSNSTINEGTGDETTMPTSSEPETTAADLPPTKKGDIQSGRAIMAQAGTLAVILPVCVRLMHLWNGCL